VKSVIHFKFDGISRNFVAEKLNCNRTKAP